LKTSDFDYCLPPELIAQKPLEPRDQSRLLVVHRKSGCFEHATFSQLPELLDPGDLLVCNDSRVVPARLIGRKAGTGGKVELLLLRQVRDGVWEALLKPSRRLRPGTTFRLVGSRVENSESSREEEPRVESRESSRTLYPEPWTMDPGPSQGPGPLTLDPEPYVQGQVLERTEAGTWLVRFQGEPDLERLGRVPLPPYVREPLADPERYQTVYARARGSVAAPTAGLHFTPHLLQGLARRGVGLAFLTVHIGLDTFRPVAVEDPGGHPIHAEWGEIGATAADQVDQARRAGRRVVAVGTSSVRLLETAARPSGRVDPFCGWTRLFILPGHPFQAVDVLLTNFHLPRTTLMMLVSAFAGRELILDAYQEAIRERYRFYSFGDAMLIV